MKLLRAFLPVSIAMLAASACAVGPTSTLYLTNYGEYSGGNVVGLDRIQGAGFASTPTGNNLDICIAVYGGDVRTTGYSQTFAGSKFDLVGNPLVGTYMNTSWDQLHDGTSDGLHNYAINYTDGNLYQFDRNWANSTVLFNPDGPNTAAYITMNVVDGSFWVSRYGGSDVVEHWTHTGTFISSFNTGISNLAGLALDPVDGTLWMSAFTGGHDLYQFSQAGTYMQTMSYSLQGTWYGMEFNTAVPEPASMLALGCGAAAMLRRRSKRLSRKG